MDKMLWERFQLAASNQESDFLKTCITEQIRDDPTFAENESEKCMSYLQERGVDITEPYAPLVNEKPIPDDPGQWSEDLFYEKVNNLRDNFAYRERIGELKRLGRGVFGNTAKKQRSAKAFRPFAGILIGLAALALIITAIMLLTRK